MDSLAKEDRNGPPWLGFVQNQVESLRFGVVQIVVHDSRVVQIDRTEKVRFDRAEEHLFLAAVVTAERAGGAQGLTRTS